MFLSIAALVAAGCGSSGKGGSGGSGGGTGTGGATGQGGGTGTGGASSTGGSSGTGGVTGSGGSTVTGGAGGTGGAHATGGAGGAPATGGASGSGGKGGSGGTGGGNPDGGAAVATPSFDWVGVVGTGQSLSVGTTPANLTAQPYNNKMLALNGAKVPDTGPDGGVLPGVDPWDPTVGGLTIVPLVEPVRALETSYPSPYPGNIYGETLHAAMANEITRFVKAASAAADYITVHTIVGESGQGIVALVKQTPSTGSIGRAYAASLFEAGAITRLAKAAGKSYGVGVIVMTHGETDCNNTGYGDALVQLLADYNTDLPAITGQTYQIPMYLSQQHGCPGAPACTKSSDLRPTANDFEWQLPVQHPGQFVCTGPKYQYPAHSDGDGIHLNVTGYELLGEKTAQVYYQRAVLGQNWQPLMPVSATRSGNVVTVQFHVPVPPLNWDTSFDPPAITEWKNGKGFELFTASGNVTISSVAISGDSVQITAGGTLPASGLTVAYALTSQGKQSSNHSKAVRWGQLRDSDPFMGGTTKMANPNYAVSFSMPVQ
ncbi:MAG TPA: dockerin [Polyangia bacterium]|nr:dockerin [Polyangia bacterium]